MSRISSETSDAMRQSAQAVTEMADQAQILKDLIAEMQAEGRRPEGAYLDGMNSERDSLAQNKDACGFGVFCCMKWYM